MATPSKKITNFLYFMKKVNRPVGLSSKSDTESQGSVLRLGMEASKFSGMVILNMYTDSKERKYPMRNTGIITLVPKELTKYPRVEDIKAKVIEPIPLARP